MSLSARRDRPPSSRNNLRDLTNNNNNNQQDSFRGAESNNGSLSHRLPTSVSDLGCNLLIIVIIY